MKMFLVLFVCASLYVYADGGMATFITPCYTKDSQCHKQSAQKALSYLAAGVPSLGLAPLDPVLIDRVQTTEAGLDLDFRNSIVKGMKNCKVLRLERNGKQSALDLKCSVTLTGDYTLGGKLLILPIEGDGKYKIKIRDIVVKIAFEVGERTVNGVKYWTVTSWKHTANVETGAHFRFDNLFKGNKQLSDTIHEFANTNWKDIFQEVAPPIVKAIVSKVVDECKKLFDKVPITELSLD